MSINSLNTSVALMTGFYMRATLVLNGLMEKTFWDGVFLTLIWVSQSEFLLEVQQIIFISAKKYEKLAKHVILIWFKKYDNIKSVCAVTM